MSALNDGAWMMKPKAGKGGKAGGNKWNKRYVWVNAEDNSLKYGAKQGKAEKSIPLAIWTEAKTMDADAVTSAKGPAAQKDNGWELVCTDRVIQFTCESSDVRDSFLSGCAELIANRPSDLKIPEGLNPDEESKIEAAEEKLDEDREKLEKEKEALENASTEEEKEKIRKEIEETEKKIEEDKKELDEEIEKVEEDHKEPAAEEKKAEGGCCVVM